VKITTEILESWNGSDAELARHLGVTRSAVGFARAKHKIAAKVNGRTVKKPTLGKTLCSAVSKEADRRAGPFADDAARLDAIRMVLGELEVWHRHGAE